MMHDPNKAFQIMGGICPVVYLLGVCILGGICPGGKCPGGKCPRGYMSGGKCPGGTCPGGGVVLSPINPYYYCIINAE